MDIEQILAGSFFGLVLQQGFVLVNNYFDFKREKTKIIFSNKLLKGERLVGLYAGLSYQVRTLIAVMQEVKLFLEDLDAEIDYDSIENSMKTAYEKLIELENKIIDEGASAYLYYDISNEGFNDTDFNALFYLNNRFAPKMELFNQLLENSEGSAEFLASKNDLISDMEKVILSFNGYYTSINNAITQLKDQSK